DVCSSDLAAGWIPAFAGMTLVGELTVRGRELLPQRICIQRPHRAWDPGERYRGPVRRAGTGRRHEKLVARERAKDVAVTVKVLEADHLLVLERDAVMREHGRREHTAALG